MKALFDADGNGIIDQKEFFEGGHPHAWECGPDCISTKRTSHAPAPCTGTPGFKKWMLNERLPLPTSGTIRHFLEQMERAANNNVLQHITGFETQLRNAA